VSTFEKTILQHNHTSTLNSISFSYNPPVNLFATGSSTGELRVWDITDYACQAYTKIQKSGKVHCVKLLRDELLISGWEDGFIRCHDAGTLNRQVWMIANAHRGGVTSIDIHISDDIQYLVSGGEDNAVRIWKLSSRELINQCTEHRRPIQRVLIDCIKPHIVHSIAIDGTTLSYDLKQSRRIMYHMIPNGTMHDMTQRKDSENELVTCDNYGRLLQWDIDYRDPVLSSDDPSGKGLRACAISPSGKYLAVGGDDELVKVYSMISNRIIAIGQGHSDSVLTAAWTPDERQVITSGVDGCLCVWNFFLTEDLPR
jgi:cilia- and flagella-associated protein 52